MTKQEAIQAQMDEIMDTFDFEDVASWMGASNWKWGGGDTGRVPDIYEIKQAARERMKAAAREGYSYTGGFAARLTEGEEDGSPWVRMALHFGYTSCNDGTNYTP